MSIPFLFPAHFLLYKLSSKTPFLLHLTNKDAAVRKSFSSTEEQHRETTYLYRCTCTVRHNPVCQGGQTDLKLYHLPETWSTLP